MLKRITSFCLILFWIFLYFTNVFAQDFDFTAIPMSTPLGSRITNIEAHSGIVFGISDHKLFAGKGPFSTFSFPPERRLRDVHSPGDRDAMVLSEEGGVSGFIISLDDVLTSTGIVVWFKNRPRDDGFQRNFVTSSDNRIFTKLAGKRNIYALSNVGIYVSRDTLKTSSIDTAGFHNAYLSDFDLDSAQYVYAASDKGLFKQHPDSSIWRFVDSLYYDYFGTIRYPYLRSVFVDRKNRILASPWTTPLGVFTSTNGGTTWTHSDQAIQGFSVGNFGDDAHGNLYAIGGPGGRTTQLFRSSDSGVTWVRIDTGITNRVKPATPDQFFNSVSGDTLLFAATAMGLFVSSNQGATWQEANQGITDENPLGIIKTPNGRMVYSGTLGIFTKEKSDSVWVKQRPIDGYQQFGGLSRGGGSLFALAENYLTSRTGLVIRSTDDGLTWQYDTAGINNVKGPCWYVDENGTQHLGTSWYSFAPEQPMIFSKPLGGSWAPDTLGLRPSGTFDDVLAFFSDRGGNLFAATREGKRLWRRPMSGGTWVLDTAGLAITDPILTGAGRNGTAYAATSLSANYPSTLHRRSGGAWSTMALPPDLNADNIDAISVDSSGTLWAAFSSFYFFVGTGVYSTTNNGVTWMKHGLDSIPVNFNSQFLGTYGLASYGDTTYVLTVGRGAYALTRSSGTTLAENDRVAPRSFALEQNFPNPFNPSTTIRYQIPEASMVTLRIYDLLGREIARLVDGIEDAGARSVQWIPNVASGVYFYRLETIPVNARGSRFVDVKKMMLLR